MHGTLQLFARIVTSIIGMSPPLRIVW